MTDGIVATPEPAASKKLGDVVSNYEGYVEFEDCECNWDSEKAALVVIYGDEVWIPKWAIHDDSETYKRGTSGNLIVVEKIAIEKELV